MSGGAQPAPAASGGGGAAAMLPSAPGEGLMVAVPAEVVAAFKDLKTRRKHAWLLMRINSEAFALEVVKTGAPGPRALSELLAALPLASGAYFVYDLPTKNSYGGQGSSLRFFTWAPAAALGKSTVVYASQRRALDGVFTGCIDSLATSKGDVEAALQSEPSAAEEEWDPDA